MPTELRRIECPNCDGWLLCDTCRGYGVVYLRVTVQGGIRVELLRVDELSPP